MATLSFNVLYTDSGNNITRVEVLRDGVSAGQTSVHHGDLRQSVLNQTEDADERAVLLVQQALEGYLALVGANLNAAALTTAVNGVSFVVPQL